jgi:hypothetical protein
VNSDEGGKPLPCQSAPAKVPNIPDRSTLVETLNQASELEHNLACVYLHAAFTLRKSPDDFPASDRDTPEKRQACEVVAGRARLWDSQLMRVSRQEMEHLGIVTNLINAIGSQPHFTRADFPIPANEHCLNIPLNLEPLNLHTLDIFTTIEAPVASQPKLIETLKAEAPARVKLAATGPHKPRLDFTDLAAKSGQGICYNSVFELYLALRSAFGSGKIPPGELFQGNLQKQVATASVPLVGNVSMTGVMNASTAQQAIDQVIAEGEGMGAAPTGINLDESHFKAFLDMRTEYIRTRDEYPEFDPAMPAVPNPAVEGGAYEPPPRSNVVKAEPARSLMLLFNDAYFVMVVMLQDFFESYEGFFGAFPPFPKVRRSAALFDAAFFPFMTMVIRPLGEILVRVPSGIGGFTAGPSYQLREKRLPDRPGLEWYEREFANIVSQAEKIAAGLGGQDFSGGVLGAESLGSKIEFLCQNLSRMSANFKRIWETGE